jgi:signal transduction histidine kinase
MTFATNTSLAFQLFAFITAAVARSESNARNELAGINAELRATRELLAESSRIRERSRISDELHDVIGHNLTALNIHLEVAKHLANGKAVEHVQKSQALAKILLQDVRN